MNIPNSPEAEGHVLGILLVSKKFDFVYSELGLRPDDFYMPLHKEIYKAMAVLADENNPIDLVSVNQKLQGNSLYNDSSALRSLADMVVTTGDLRYYTQIIKDLSSRRRYIAVSAEIARAAADEGTELEEVNSLFDKLMNTENDKSETIMETIMSVYKELVKACDHKGRIPGTSTGWADLDCYIGGMEKGNLVVVGGRPAMGKSIFGANIAGHVAKKLKKAAIVFSLEMPKKQVSLRMLSSLAGVNYRDCRFGQLTGEDFQRIGVAMNEITQLPLIIDDNASANIAYIKAVCRRAKRKHGDIGVVVIDYIQLISPGDRRAGTRNEEVSQISRGLKQMAKELNCPVVALSQISRAVEQRPDKRPNMSDLRESGGIEQDADTVMMLYRDEYYNSESNEKGIAEVIITKAREGKTGTVKLGWKPENMRFLPIEYVQEEVEANA